MSTPSQPPWEPGADADRGYALFTKECRVVAADGTPIAYTHRNRTGTAVPVLLANGWSCSDAYWGKLVPILEERGHPVLLPDTRGHGRSGLPRTPGRGARNLTLDDVSMPRIAADLLAVLDDAGVTSAVVVGHSMGVQTALELYRLDPKRVAGMVLVAGTAENPAKTFYGSPLGDLAFPVGAAVMRWLPELLSPVWATIGPASVGHFGARLVRAAGPKATREDLHPYLLHLRSVDPAVVVLMAGAMRAHSAADLLPTIDAPTLVVAAGADVFTPARCSEAIHHQIPGSELVSFRDAGHTIPVEEPEALAAAIDDFVARRVTAPPSRRRAKPPSRKGVAKKAAGKKATGKDPPPRS
jgi:pimeloyl-ACP methyl ester carboxylesterase